MTDKGREDKTYKNVSTIVMVVLMVAITILLVFNLLGRNL